MKIILTLTVAGLMAAPATAQGFSFTETENQMVEMAAELNSQCRGSSDQKIIQKYCPMRDKFFVMLKNDAKLCYGRKDEYGYQHQWHRCAKDSL